MANFKSDIPLPIPQMSSVPDQQTRGELQLILDSIRMLQLELSSCRSRIAALEAYNIAHP